MIRRFFLSLGENVIHSRKQVITGPMNTRGIVLSPLIIMVASVAAFVVVAMYAFQTTSEITNSADVIVDTDVSGEPSDDSIVNAITVNAGTTDASSTTPGEVGSGSAGNANLENEFLNVNTDPSANTNPANASEPTNVNTSGKSCSVDEDCGLLICSGCFSKEYLKTAPPDLACRAYEGYRCICSAGTCTETK